MNRQINEDKKMAIEDILQSSNTLEKVKKFILYKDKLSDCRIFLFDEKYSNFDDSLKNKNRAMWNLGNRRLYKNLDFRLKIYFGRGFISSW